MRNCYIKSTLKLIVATTQINSNCVFKYICYCCSYFMNTVPWQLRTGYSSPT